MKRTQFLTGLTGMLAATAVAMPGDTYIIKKGDTYSEIAEREIKKFPGSFPDKSIYGLAKELEDYNKTPATKLQIGQKIRIPPQNIKRGFSINDSNLLAQTLYAEAQNQTREAREEVARLVNTRIHRPDFPNTLKKVIFQEDAFEGVGGNQWNKVERGELNDYEQKIYDACKTIGNKVFTQNLRTDSIAYHDTSIPKPKSPFWDNLVVNKQMGKLIFYKEQN